MRRVCCGAMGSPEKMAVKMNMFCMKVLVNKMIKSHINIICSNLRTGKVIGAYGLIQQNAQ